MAAHSSTLAWKIPWTEEPGRLQSMGSLGVGLTERLPFHFSLSCIGEGNGNALQCSCLESPRDGGAWWTAVNGVAQNWTWLKWLSSSKAEVDVFLELSCFLYDSMDVGNLTYGSPAFSKSNLNIWKFSVQFSYSVLSDSATPWTAACQASLSITNSWSLPKLMFIELVMPSNHLILCRPLLLLPSVFPSIRIFSNESALHIRWPKYWNFSFSISPSNEHSGSPCSPRDSQESSPTPQFKSINSSALSFLYSPTLTSIHDYWKNHSLD